MLKASFFRALGVAWLAMMAASAAGAHESTPEADAARPAHGIEFSCPSSQLPALRQDMAAYLGSLGLALAQEPAVPSGLAADAAVVLEEHTTADGQARLRYSLPSGSAWGTLFLAWQPQWALRDEVVYLPTAQGGRRPVATVSRKEILLALLSPGRLTRFSEGACDVQALADHVGLRQNIVAWAEELSWVWPNGDPAFWNARYWIDGTPRPGVALADALNDVFFRQKAYGFGCYAATRLVFVQGVYDYYRRVKRDPALARQIVARLMADGEPLVDIEPPALWSLAPPAQDLERPGKLVRATGPVAPMNFVPGDWAYIRNTDPVSSDDGGYEGSNTLYLGRNRFDDYYNDNGHTFSFREKLEEVHEWRHGMYARLRDYALLQPVKYGDVERLSAAPEAGGLLEAVRAVPYYFGYETLPALSPVP